MRLHHGTDPRAPERVKIHVKKIRFDPNTREEVRSIKRRAAINILAAIHRYAETGAGRVKPLSGEFEGLFRLRVGNHRVIFEETEDTVTIHRVRDRRDAYRRAEGVTYHSSAAAKGRPQHHRSTARRFKAQRTAYWQLRFFHLTVATTSFVVVAPLYRAEAAAP